jgi:3' exoribonuclease, RNase T-like
LSLLAEVKMLAFDIESLGHNENSVVLSMAFTYFETDKKYTIDELRDNTSFVKFDIKEQKINGRTIDPDTVAWWKKQCEIVQKKSLFPSKDDVSVLEGLGVARKFISEKTNNKEDYIFVRGNLDNFLIDSLCNDYGVPVLFNFWQVLDFRTAIIMTKETSNKNGYCPFPGSDDPSLLKHCPVNDNIIEIMQLLYGK